MQLLLLMVFLSATRCGLTLPRWVKRVSSCPLSRNLKDWKRAASGLGCDNFTSASDNPLVYHCMPSSFLNETVEFCGRNVPHIGGSCPIYTYKYGENTAPNFRNCSMFRSGCPSKFFHSKMIYKYPACLNINKIGMCYEADPSCCSNETCLQPIFKSSEEVHESITKWGLLGGGVLLGIVIIFVTILMILRYRCKQDIPNQRTESVGKKNSTDSCNETVSEKLSLMQSSNDEVNQHSANMHDEGECEESRSPVQISYDEDVPGERSRNPRLWCKFHETEEILTEKVCQFFKEKMIICSPPKEIRYFNILIVGPTGTGKSSFINTCLTAVSHVKEMRSSAKVGGNSTDTVTINLYPYPLQYEKDAALPIRLFDCRGILDIDRIGLKEIELIIKGHIKPRSEIKMASKMIEDKAVYREDPTIKNAMHCVVFVLRADKAIDCKKQLMDLRKLLEELGIPLCILYTAIDKIEGSSDDVKGIFQNANVEEACRRLSDSLNFDFISILPMSNYHDEWIPTPSKNALAVRNLKCIVDRAVDHLNQKYSVDEDFYD